MTAIEHKLRLEQTGTRFRALCTCGDFRSPSSNDRSRAERSWKQHLRGKGVPQP